MKEMSNKNSLVLTRKLAPKEEEWTSLQRAVNFQTSWNFVIKKYFHCSTLNSIPSWYMKRNESEIVYALPIFILFFAALFAIWPGASSPCSYPCVSRTPCRPKSPQPRRWRMVRLAWFFTSNQAWLTSPSFPRRILKISSGLKAKTSLKS